jgi:hypothetical protein
VVDFRHGIRNLKSARQSALVWLWSFLLTTVLGVFCLLKGFPPLGFGGNLILALIAMCAGLYCMRRVQAFARAELDEGK